MDDRLQASKTSCGMDSELEAFTNGLIQDRIDNGHVDLRTMSYSEMEQLGHEIGQRVARMLGVKFCERQGELFSDDYNCPTCGLECEAIKHPRTVQSIDGPAEIVELRSYCPKCRRNFFPCAERQRPR